MTLMPAPLCRCSSDDRPKPSVRFIGKLPVEVNGGAPDRIGGKTCFCKSSRPAAEPNPKFTGFGEFSDGLGERFSVIYRYEKARITRHAISRQPGTSVAMSGRPQAAASSRLLRTPSPPRDGSAAICAFAHSAAISVTWPSQVMPGSRPQDSASVLCTELGLARIGRTRNQQISQDAALAQQTMRGDKRADALDLDQPATQIRR